MLRWAKIVVLTVLVLAVLVFDVFVALAIVARSRGVEAATLPGESLVATLAADADYTDAYRVRVSALDFPSVEVFDSLAFERGSGVVGRAPGEVVYRGRAPGLQYHVSYLLTSQDDDRWVTLSTAVHYESGAGRAYFAAVRVGHWALTPWLLSKWRE